MVMPGKYGIPLDQVQSAHLHFHDDSSSMYQSFDIDMPYLILYESVDIDHNLSVYQEYTESSRQIFQNTYQVFTKRKRKLHFHNFYELTFVLSGSLNMQIEDELVTLAPGDCCLCNKNIHHLELMDKNTEIILFLLREEFIKDLMKDNFFYDEKGISHPIGSVFDMFFAENRKDVLTDAKIYANFRVLSPDAIQQVLCITNSMIEEIVGKHSGKTFMMKAFFCRFFELLEDEKLYQRNIHKAKLVHAEMIIESILKAYRDHNDLLTRSEIEDVTGYNSDYVERIVKKYTGKTLSEYGRELILQRVAYDLVHSTEKITDLCIKYGYSNRTYFNKLFISAFGMTPSEYRTSEHK